MHSAGAAQPLGIERVFPGERIWLDNMWFYVAGILNPAVLAPTIDASALVGFTAAEHYLGLDGYRSTIYVPAQTNQVDAVDSLVGVTANPQNPSQVDVSRPSSALVARADAQGALDDLFLGLRAVARRCRCGDIMISSVLERRSEIGLRRALGATRGPVGAQFLAEAILLALVRGAAGVEAGAPSSAVYASTKHELVVIPAVAWGARICAAILIGAVAALFTALRAARTSPTQTLWSM
jgi:putative ABC transport system permease protein